MDTKKIAIAVAFTCGMGLSANTLAAGANDWAGAYIGGHLGYGTNNGVELDYGNNPSDSFDMKGYLIGLQGGYNWAIGPVVVGVEGSASYADVNGEAPCPNPTWICAATMDQLITVSGKVGMPINNFLLYGSLGLASGQVEAMTIDPAGVEYSDTARQTGWVLGLGGEMTFSKKLRGRAELMYIDLGEDDYLVDSGDFVSVETKVVGLRIGADWNF